MGFSVDRKLIKMNEDSIKTVGTRTAEIRLHKEVIVPVTFEVVAE